jgi:lipoprotein LprG
MLRDGVLSGEQRSTVMQSVAIGLGAGCLVLAGCGGSDSSDDPPEDRLAAAKTSLDDADFIGFTIETDDLPSDVDGLVKAEGTGTHEPAFTGKVDVDAAVSISADVVAVDGVVYADLPVIGWNEIDPADYGAPDPAALMDTDSGISSLFTATEDLTSGDDVREGSDVFSTIDGTIPGDAVNALFPSAGTDPFDVSYRLTDDDEIDAITVTGPFYEGSDDVTYQLDFDLDADEVDIQPPD